jgi:hypothetical protein
MEIKPEAQYREVYESWRQHDRLIWQTPSIIVVVAGALVGASFALGIPWWAREFIIGFAFILSSVLTFALIKHRYFIDIEQANLLYLEKNYAIKSIQRMSRPLGRRRDNYVIRKANWFENISAHQIYRLGMYAICYMLLFLLPINWRMGDSYDWYNPTINILCWWIVIGICSALVIVATIILCRYIEWGERSNVSRIKIKGES